MTIIWSKVCLFLSSSEASEVRHYLAMYFWGSWTNIVHSPTPTQAWARGTKEPIHQAWQWRQQKYEIEPSPTWENKWYIIYLIYAHNRNSNRHTKIISTFGEFCLVYFRGMAGKKNQISVGLNRAFIVIQQVGFNNVLPNHGRFQKLESIKWVTKQPEWVTFH